MSSCYIYFDGQNNCFYTNLWKKDLFGEMWQFDEKNYRIIKIMRHNMIMCEKGCLCIAKLFVVSLLQGVANSRILFR